MRPAGAQGPLRRVLAEPGTPYGRLGLAGLLGLAAAAATIGLLAGSGYVVGRAALRPGLSALVGILAAVEVLAFLRGPLRYAERLVGHDAALRALTRWRVWLYDCLSPRVPAALAGWRSGDLLARAIDDVDALQDLYLRTLLPVAIATGAAAIGTVAVGLILPWAAVALGVPLLVALTVPALLTWRRGGDDDVAALGGSLSAQVVDALAGAPELLAFGAETRFLGAVEELGLRADVLERRHARRATGATLLIQVCLGIAVTAVLATGVAAVHAHHLGQVMVAVLPLAVLATFETVPAVPLAVAHALEVRASSRRLFALEDVPIPVRDPATPLPPAEGVPDVVFTAASLRYDPGLPRALDGVSMRLPAGGRVAVTGSSGAGKSSLVTALLRYWPLEDGALALGDVDVEDLLQADARARLRAGRPAGADVCRDGAFQRRPREAGRHRGGDHRRAPRGTPRSLGGRLARRARHARRRGWRGPIRRRAQAPGGGPRAAGARSGPRARRAHQRTRRSAGRRADGRRPRRGGRAERACHHAPDG